jgi:hypothetical protein
LCGLSYVHRNLPGRANTNVPDAVSTALPDRSNTCCSKCALAVFVAALKARKSSRPFALAAPESNAKKAVTPLRIIAR